MGPGVCATRSDTKATRKKSRAVEAVEGTKDCRRKQPDAVELEDCATQGQINVEPGAE